MRASGADDSEAVGDSGGTRRDGAVANTKRPIRNVRNGAQRAGRARYGAGARRESRDRGATDETAQSGERVRARDMWQDGGCGERGASGAEAPDARESETARGATQEREGVGRNEPVYEVVRGMRGPWQGVVASRDGGDGS